MTVKLDVVKLDEANDVDDGAIENPDVISTPELVYTVGLTMMLLEGW